MPITLDGSNGITTPTYGGADTSEYLVPVTGFKNRIINGNMSIDQRNAGASVTPTATTYTLDRFLVALTQASKFSVQQNAGSVTPPAGFTNYLGITSTSAYAVLTGDFFLIRHYIEGTNVGDLAWGTANAKTVTLSFWVRSSLTGTFGGSIQNNAENRSYPFSYTISSANTWEQKSITIAGDTTGTWVTNTGVGMRINFGLGAGSTYGGGTAGAWVGSDFRSTTGATSVVGTNGATFYITGVQLEVGSTATSFDYRPYGTELALCQRYCYQISYNTTNNTTILSNGTQNSASDARGMLIFPVTMRVSPTGSAPTGSNFYAYDKPATGFIYFNTMLFAYNSPNGCLLYASVTGGTTGYGIVLYLTFPGSYVRFDAEL